MNGIVHSVNVQRKSVKIEEGTSQDHCSVAVSMQPRTPIAVSSQPQSASKSVIEHCNISEVASARAVTVKRCFRAMNGIVHSVNVQRKSVKIEEGTSQDHCSVAVSMQPRTPIAVNSSSQPQRASKSVIEHRNISEVASAVSASIYHVLPTFSVFYIASC
ncbi:unnamed protein product [Toxocara canis]|uniref:Expressed conserved protein n=1 Tax=Toxocara canis TaxID=6265 RepID=A0A183VHI1_TOXCA|nr:unnamed protein product [Toxocara canis]